MDEGLTINDCRLAGELGGGSNDRGISVAPIMSVAAKDTHLAALNHYLRAISIGFDFMNPMLPFWRLIDQDGSCGSMNLESGMEYGKHRLGTLNRRSPDGGARASSAHHKACVEGYDPPRRYRSTTSRPRYGETVSNRSKSRMGVIWVPLL